MVYNTCPFCQLEGAPSGPSGPDYHCLRCGPFRLDPDWDWFVRQAAHGTIHLQTAEGVGEAVGQLHLLSGYIRQASLEGREPPILDRERADLVLRTTPRTVRQRIDRYLLNLDLMSDGDAANPVKYVANTDYPLAYCRNAGEFEYLVGYLHKVGFFESIHHGEFVITVAGWEAISHLHEASEDSSQVFVAMSFDPTHYHIFDEAIAPAVEAAGYTARIMREHDHAGIIDVEMLLEVRRSRCLIAEMTDVNAGAYFEAGYAIGIGIPVLFACDETEIDNQHFDTNHYSYTIWSTTDDLRKKLAARIEFVVGRGPLTVP